MRYLVAGLLAFHGLLHILGLQWGKITGALWSAAWVILLAAALLCLRDEAHWWIVAGVGILLSQALIIGAWPAARAGTLVNLLLLAPVLSGAGQDLFHHQSVKVVSQLLSTAPAGPGPVVTAADVASLPPPVRSWLEGAGVIGRPRVRTVELDQAGEMRTAADGPWMPVSARQWFTVEQPGFVWTARLTMKGVPVVGRDSYLGGRGRMLISGTGLFALVDGRGAEIDQGTLLRYLAEIIWFPSAALAPYLRWDPIDAHRARVTMNHGGVTASAVYTFDARGRVQEMSAQRYLGAGGKTPTLERWSGRVSAWGAPSGVVIPTEGVVSWKLASGDFDYFRWRITRVVYDRGAPVPAPEAPVSGAVARAVTP
jgi:hypothetical protein